MPETALDMLTLFAQTGLIVATVNGVLAFYNNNKKSLQPTETVRVLQRLPIECRDTASVRSADTPVLLGSQRSGSGAPSRRQTIAVNHHGTRRLARQSQIPKSRFNGRIIANLNLLTLPMKLRAAL